MWRFLLRQFWGRPTTHATMRDTRQFGMRLLSIAGVRTSRTRSTCTKTTCNGLNISKKEKTRSFESLARVNFESDGNGKCKNNDKYGTRTHEWWGSPNFGESLFKNLESTTITTTSTCHWYHLAAARGQAIIQCFSALMPNVSFLCREFRIHSLTTNRLFRLCDRLHSHDQWWLDISASHKYVCDMRI